MSAAKAAELLAAVEQSPAAAAAHDRAGSTVAVSITSAQRRAVLFFDVIGRGAPISEVRYFPGA